MTKVLSPLYSAVFIAVLSVLSLSTEAGERALGSDAVAVDVASPELHSLAQASEIRCKNLVAQAGWRNGYENALVKGQMGMEKAEKPGTLSAPDSRTTDKAQQYQRKKPAVSPSKRPKQ
jgi:hypothetical protein